MPLLDHFHPPLSPVRRWEPFHGQWAGAIASFLNTGRLPKDYSAEIQAHVGSRFEIDIAAMHDERDEGPAERESDQGGVATIIRQSGLPRALFEVGS